MSLFEGSPNIEILKAQRNIKGLIEALEYNRHFHWSVLSPTSDQEKAKRYASVRAAAAAALGEIGDPVAVDPLVSALGDAQVVRVNAAVALGQIGDERAIGPLIRLDQAEKDYAVKELVRDVLLQMGPPAVVPLIKHILGHSEQAAGSKGTLVRLGTAAVDPLITEIVNNPDSAVREHAARVLAEIRDPRAIPALSKALQYPDHDVRSAAAAALSSLNYSPATEIERAIYAVARGDWDLSVKMGAAVIEPLLLALDSKDEYFRTEAARSLGQIGDPRAVGALIKGLAPFFHNLSSSKFRSVVVTALKQIDDEKAIVPLTEAAKSDKWIGGETVAVIRSMLSKHLATIDEDGLRVIAALEHIVQGHASWGEEVNGSLGGDSPVDCSDIRDIARRELARRATP